MKLHICGGDGAQPDPFVLFDDGTWYLYATGNRGVQLYTAKESDGDWTYEGLALAVDGLEDFWAPSVIRLGNRYYMYVSCRKRGVFFEYLHVASSDSPRGPFGNIKRLYDRFTIDSHVVRTEAGLFLFYAENNVNDPKKGTRIFLDRLRDPETPENRCREILSPTFAEEISAHDQNGIPGDWYTLEGPFWFSADGWQYLMYSAGSFTNDTYHIGYAVAHTDEPDLLKVDFVKHTVDGRFDPLLIRNEREEGTGHNSVETVNGKRTMFYHARDYGSEAWERTARSVPLIAGDGILSVGDA